MKDEKDQPNQLPPNSYSQHASSATSPSGSNVSLTQQQPVPNVFPPQQFNQGNFPYGQLHPMFVHPQQQQQQLHHQPQSHQQQQQQQLQNQPEQLNHLGQPHMIPHPQYAYHYARPLAPNGCFIQPMGFPVPPAPIQQQQHSPQQQQQQQQLLQQQLYVPTYAVPPNQSQSSPPLQKSSPRISKPLQSSSSSSDDVELKKKRKRLSIACTTCRKRKIKCDRQRPICGSCQKNNVPIHLCIYDDSPWVSSLVKEQSLQTEIDSLIEQRKNLKEGLAQKEEEVSKLKRKLKTTQEESVANAGQKTITINSLINTEDSEEEKDPILDIIKFYIFRDGECNGLFTLQNIIRLTPSLPQDFSLAAGKKHLVKRYKACTIKELVNDLPSFKKIEAKFEYIFDINYDHRFHFISILKEPAIVRSIFYKIFTKKHKINYKHIDQLELCYCLLILKFGIIFNEEDEFHDVNIYSICLDILATKLQVASPSLFLLENLLLLNNLTNIIALSPEDSNMTVPQFINVLVNKLYLQHTNEDKKLWFHILYQDYFISLTNGTPLLITEVNTTLEVDEDNFDDIAWSAILLIRKIYSSYRIPNTKLHDSEWKIIQFHTTHILKFDLRFYANFHIRTINSGVDKDKRLLVSLLCIDLILGIKFLKYLNNNDSSLIPHLTFTIKLVGWILEQIVAEETFSKNRCLQIAIVPVVKNLILKAMTIALNFTTENTRSAEQIDESTTTAVDMWDLPVQDAEKVLIYPDPSKTTKISFTKYSKAVASIHSNAKKIDLFLRDDVWMREMETLVDATNAHIAKQAV